MKKLFTRAFAVFLCMAVLGSVNFSILVAAEETTVSDVSEILTLFDAWGITTGTEISEDVMGNLASPDNISIIFDNIEANPPVFSGDIVRQKDLTEAVVNMLGYKSVVERYGSYNKIATTLNLFNGIKYATSEAATYEYVIKMLDNALDCKVMLPDYSNPDKSAYVVSDETFSKKMLNIYKANGIVRANGEYALDEALQLSNDYVMIGAEIYEKNGVNIDSLLGCDVEFYYKTDDSDDTPKLLYAKMHKDGKMIVIDSSDIAGYENKQYTYYVGNKQYKNRFNSDAIVIYNTVPVSKYTDEMLKPISGSIILVDSDGNGSYDVVNVTSYTYIMAGAIDKINKRIFDKSNPTVSLEYDNNTHFLLPDGKEISIDAVTADSVLSVAKSEQRTTIIVTNDVVTGVVMGITDDEDKTITINDITYDVSPYFYGDLPEPSEKVTCYLNHNAEVYYCQKVDKDEVKYGYVTKVLYFNETGDYEIILQLCKTDGKLSSYKLADKVKIDGVLCKKTEQMRDMLTDENKQTKYQLIVYELNADDKIVYIDTPYNSAYDLNTKPTDKEGEDSLHFTFSSYVGSSVNKQVANVLEGSRNYYVIGGKAVLNGSTIYLSIPVDSAIPTADEEDFGTKAIWTIEDDKLCDIETYTLGKGLLATVAIKREKAVKEVEGGNYAGIVTSTYLTLDEKNNTVVRGVKVLKSGIEYELWYEQGKQFPTGDGKQMCDIRYGDAIIVNASAYQNGEIITAKVIARIEDGKPVYTDNTVRMDSAKNEAIGDYTAKFQTIFASVLKKSGEVLYIQPEQTMEGQSLEPFYNVALSNYTTVYVCETTPKRYNKNITVGSVDDIITHEQSDTDYSRCLVYTSWANMHMIIIYK